MEITKELFVIPYEGRTILYAPLEGSALEVTPGVIGLIQRIQKGEDPAKLNSDITDRLKRSRILVDKSGTLSERGNCDSGYSPTSVTLLPTYNCNLRCVYCYSRGGEEIGKVMTEEIARASIDFIVENAGKTKINKISLGFHGGGEPLLAGNMGLVRYAVEYAQDQAKRKNLRCNISTASNGVFSEETLEWVVHNMNHLGLSLDGPEDIQNSQRPIFGDYPSFQRVLGTIKRLEELPEEIKRRFSYGLRATITSKSVERMPEILEFFASISKNHSFHLEPLFECGRCGGGGGKSSEASSPDPQIFLESMIKTNDLARRLGIEVYYSGSAVEKIGETFCGACGSNFFITPEGHVTSCVEACRPSDRAADIFFIGKFNPELKKFEFNESKRAILSERKVSKIVHCEDCFAKYNCAGDCPAKVWEQGGDLNDPSNNWRCQINRGLLAYNLAARLDQEKDKSAKIEQKSGELKAC